MFTPILGNVAKKGIGSKQHQRQITCVLRLVLGCDGSAERVLAAKPDDLSLILRTHIEGENQLP